LQTACNKTIYTVKVAKIDVKPERPPKLIVWINAFWLPPERNACIGCGEKGDVDRAG
jgi:hypothetical protein